jgi:hypothetical protein
VNYVIHGPSDGYTVSTPGVSVASTSATAIGVGDLTAGHQQVPSFDPMSHIDTKIAVCPKLPASFAPCYETSGVVDGIVLPIVVLGVAGIVTLRAIGRWRPPSAFAFVREF